MYVYIYIVCIVIIATYYIHIYIYICVSLSLSIYLYIYIYTHAQDLTAIQFSQPIERSALMGPAAKIKGGERGEDPIYVHI